MTDLRYATVTRPTGQLEDKRPDRASDWTDDAACGDWQGWPFDPWDPPLRALNGRPYDRRYEDPWKVGRDICDTCPVKAICLDRKLDEEVGQPINLRFLMWGGMTPRERWDVDHSKQPRHIAIAEVTAKRTRKAEERNKPKEERPTSCAQCGATIDQPPYGVRLYCTAACSRRARRIRFYAKANDAAEIEAAS